MMEQTVLVVLALATLSRAAILFMEIRENRVRRMLDRLQAEAIFYSFEPTIWDCKRQEKIGT